MKSIILMVVVAILATTTSQAQINNTKVETVNLHGNHQQNEVKSTTVQTNQLTTVFDNYFALKDNLVKTDGISASENAKGLVNAINAVKMDKLPMNVHTVWMKLLNGLKEDAEHINETKDIVHQRDHFMSLSKNMYEVIKVANPVEPVYYQFCPMANQGKGANWLSRETAIKNPYYGSRMLSCGKVVETIKP